MMSSDARLPHQYGFTNLRNITEGRHNIIAVVKFYKPPQKTRGSGFSMFFSISDPSLRGDKFSVTVINNNIERLPPIHSPGDIVIMHRLSVSKFRERFQGYGSENLGFAALVFPGAVDADLTPYESPVACTFTHEDLVRVQELRNWYNSPDCPLEKEVPRSLNPLQPRTDQDTPYLSRIHLAKVNSYFNTEAQVVAIYNYPPEVTHDLILCLWDGIPPTNCSDLPHFYTASDLERPPSVRAMQMDPHLVCITGHSVLPASEDWSVCVFVFDEHTEPARSLKPGDYVRLYNLHCVSKHHLDKRKVDMHGGGHRYGRRIEVLTEEKISEDLLERLRLGRMARQSLNAASLSPDLESLQMFTIAQLFDFLGERDSAGRAISTDLSSTAIFHVRVCGRVVGVIPSRSEYLLHHVLLKCGICEKTQTIGGEDWSICECKSDSNFGFLPAFLMELEDVSGRMSTVVSTSGIEALLNSKLPDFRAQIRKIIKGKTIEDRVKAGQEIIVAWNACVGGWVDATLLVIQNISQGGADCICFEC